MKKTLSFVSGLMLALLAVLFSVAVPAMNSARFEKAVLNTVNCEAVGMSESDLTAFARETMDYLHGRQDAWQPQTPFAISADFTQHMADVRAAAAVLKIILPAGLLLALAGLWFGGDGRMARFGMLTLLGIAAAVLLWAAIDFQSLWYILHVLFIPGGIFAVGEMVMLLFPLKLFFSYVPAVVCWLVGLMAAAGGVTWLFSRRCS